MTQKAKFGLETYEKPTFAFPNQVRPVSGQSLNKDAQMCCSDPPAAATDVAPIVGGRWERRI